MEYDLSFEDLMELCSKKILAKVPKTSGKMQGAFNGGDYLGRPGKDIYFFLPKLNVEQFYNIVDQLSLRFPHDPPTNHVGYAGCIRYIYGQFEKQGILRSEGDLQRMQGENIDWNLPRKFMYALRDKFLEQKNYYGLCIYYEMEAHRMGDKAILKNDIDMLNKMEKSYLMAVEYAGRCNSYKQLFTPYYWCFEYFKKYKNKKKALKYARLTIKNADRYCPDARPGYVTKLFSCIKYIKKYDKDGWKIFCDRYKNSKNKCVKKTFKKYKKG